MKKTPADELLIGAHTSAQGGAFNAIIEGHEIGATTVQLFTSNQKRWEGKQLTDKEVELFQEAVLSTGLTQIMSHDSYLINLGSPHSDTLHKSRKAFKEELVRCQKLGLAFLNFHPGAALESTAEECLEKIVESLELLEPLADRAKTRLLIETTAGQGTCVGWRFEHLGMLIDRLHKKIPIGVCIDTCHIFVAGYDIRTAEGWEKTLLEFDETIGLSHLFAFHVNDSLKDLGSRVDRHAGIGQGKIGLESFRFLMNSQSTRDLPKYLETPDGPAGWKKEIVELRKFAE